jgi:hypothetical protein
MGSRSMHRVVKIKEPTTFGPALQTECSIPEFGKVIKAPVSSSDRLDERQQLFILAISDSCRIHAGGYHANPRG